MVVRGILSKRGHLSWDAGVRQAKTKRLIIPDSVMGPEDGRSLAHSRDCQRRPLYLLTTLKTGVISVCSSLLPSLRHTCWRTVSSQQDLLMDREWIDVSLGNSWCSRECGDCPDESHCPPLRRSPSYTELLRLLVIPGYSGPRAAQLSQTFLTAVRASEWTMNWRRSTQKRQEKGMQTAPAGSDPVEEKRIAVITKLGLTLR